MTLNRVSAEMKTRAKGHSALSFAAYIDRTSYLDERTGKKTKDFGNEGPLEWSEVWIPKGAPEWMRDPEKLWNAVEKAEDVNRKRDTALLLRSWIIAIPHWEGQTREDRIHMTKDIMREFTRHDWIAHAAIHAPDKDSPNYHIHIGNPMRFITEDGFGKRREACTDERFEKKVDELKWWKEKWSEIGARHLEKAGHQLEADRFRKGYESREEKLNDALNRGDKQRADELEDRPHIHMGRAAHYMEEKDIPTRKGDINRGIDEHNRQRQAEREKARENGRDAPDSLRGTGREIWWAYNGTTNAHEFKASLEDRGILLARIDRRDATNSRVEFAAEQNGKYVPRYQEGEYVAVNERGHAYHLNRTNTGDNPAHVNAFMGSLSNTLLPNLENARKTMEERSESPDRRSTSERDLGTAARFEKAGRGPDNQVGGDAEHIYWAYKNARDPQAFVKDIQSRGLHIARVTEDDAQHSQVRNHLNEKFNSKYTPIFREGEYLIVNDRGWTFRLNERTTGHSREEVKAFMKPLDGREIKSLRTTLAEGEERRFKATDKRPWSPGIGRELKNGAKTVGRGAGRALIWGTGKTDRVISRGGKVVNFGVNLFEALFTPMLSPEQRRQQDIAREKREELEDRAAKDRGYDRDR